MPCCARVGGACAAQNHQRQARQVTFLTLSPQPIALLSPGLSLPLAHRSVRQRQRQTQSPTLDTIQEQLTPSSFSSQLHRSEHHPPTQHSSPPGSRANRKRRLPRSKSAPSQMAQPRPCPLPRQPQNGPRRVCLVAPHWLEVPGWRFPAVLHPPTIPDSGTRVLPALEITDVNVRGHSSLMTVGMPVNQRPKPLALGPNRSASRPRVWPRSLATLWPLSGRALIALWSLFAQDRYCPVFLAYCVSDPCFILDPSTVVSIIPIPPCSYYEEAL